MPESPPSAGKASVEASANPAMGQDRGDAAGRPLGATLRLGAIIAAYLSLNSSLNLLNKWALGNFFSFPLLLTTVHMAFSFLMLLPFMLTSRYGGQHMSTLTRQWKGLVCIGIFMATNIALNNLSLVHISLSLNQVIRSAIPVATAILAVSIEGKTPTQAEFGALLVLTAGVMIAVWEGLRGSALGILFACLGMVSNAAMMSTSGRVLSEKLEVIRLTFYTAPVSCAALLPFFLWREARVFHTFVLTDWHTAVAILLITSLNALLYNLIHYKMIAMTSAVTTTVIGEGKIVGLLVLSAVLLGEGKEYSLKMFIGCGLAMTGFVMFSHCKLAQAQARAAEKAEAVNGEQPGGHELQSLLQNGDHRGNDGVALSPQKHRRANVAT